MPLGFVYLTVCSISATCFVTIDLYLKGKNIMTNEV